MEITWYGHACFRITERGFATVVTDPYDSAVVGYNPLKLKADIVTVSCNDLGHNNLSAVKGGAFESPDLVSTSVEVSLSQASKPRPKTRMEKPCATRSTCSIMAN